MAALQQSGLAAALRGSTWAYPLVNAGHILGIALLLGSIIPLDLRILGLWKSIALLPLYHVLTRTSAAGLILAVVCGVLLFITRAAAYSHSGLFIFKMAMVITGIVNAVILHAGTTEARLAAMPRNHPPPRNLRWAAGISLSAWITALFLGRLIGYF